ncbi:MAG: hypothetical protein Q7K42_03760, partial [Candidatus Diapherotrites archaeon]|nr:hypothetical protein [Candidatus Diapherotrites archaeon]
IIIAVNSGVSEKSKKKLDVVKEIVQKELSFKVREFHPYYDFVKKFYKISDKELSVLKNYPKEIALQELVLEKISLVL